MRSHYTCGVGYFWLEIALAGLRGIDPYEVLQALSAERRYPVRGQSPEGVLVLTIWARTRSGRPLLIALRRVPGSPRDWWIIGARDLSDAERALFQQWEKEAGDKG